MDWMQTLVIIMAVVLIVLLVVVIVVGVAGYKLIKKSRAVVEHLEFSAANVEKATSGVARIASTGFLAKFAGNLMQSYFKSKTGGGNGKNSS